MQLGSLKRRKKENWAVKKTIPFHFHHLLGDKFHIKKPYNGHEIIKRLNETDNVTNGFTLA